MVVSRLASIAGRKLAKKLATKLSRSAWRKKHYKSLKPYAIKAKSLKSYKTTKFQNLNILAEVLPLFHEQLLIMDRAEKNLR